MYLGVSVHIVIDKPSVLLPLSAFFVERRLVHEEVVIPLFLGAYFRVEACQAHVIYHCLALVMA